MSHIVITNENNGIKRFRLATIIRGLDLEINTGLKLTRNMPSLKVIREQYGVEGGTKVKVLAALRELDAEIDAGTFDAGGLPG